MRLAPLALALLCASITPARAETPAEPVASLARMPVKEATVFKDGHAFVVQQGRVATDSGGFVVLDRLPVPVLGTFWPYSAERDVKLSAVTASRRRVRGEQTATDLRGLLEANPGASVELVDVDGKSISGRIRGLPSRPVDELQALEGSADRDLVPARGGVVLIETGQGVLALPIERVRSVSFKGAPTPKFASESFRNVMTLGFVWPQGRPRRDIEVGMAYVQKGLRWIPSYRVTIDGAGKARVQLQATLVNELTDLDNVTVNLVIGVPTFAFRTSSTRWRFRRPWRGSAPTSMPPSVSGQALSNAVMSQVGGMAPGTNRTIRRPSSAPVPGPRSRAPRRTRTCSSSPSRT